MRSSIFNNDPPIRQLSANRAKSSLKKAKSSSPYINPATTPTIGSNNNVNNNNNANNNANNTSTVSTNNQPNNANSLAQNNSTSTSSTSSAFAKSNTPNPSTTPLSSSSSYKSKKTSWNLDDLIASYQDNGLLPPILSPTLPEHDGLDIPQIVETSASGINSLKSPKPTRVAGKRKLIIGDDEEEDSTNKQFSASPRSNYSNTPKRRERDDIGSEEDEIPLSMLSPTLPSIFDSNGNSNGNTPDTAVNSGGNANTNGYGSRGEGSQSEHSHSNSNVSSTSTTSFNKPRNDVSIKWINKVAEMDKFLLRITFNDKNKYKSKIARKNSSPLKLAGLGITTNKDKEIPKKTGSLKRDVALKLDLNKEQKSKERVNEEETRVKEQEDRKEREARARKEEEERRELRLKEREREEDERLQSRLKRERDEEERREVKQKREKEDERKERSKKDLIDREEEIRRRERTLKEKERNENDKWERRRHDIEQREKDFNERAARERDNREKEFRQREASLKEKERFLQSKEREIADKETRFRETSSGSSSSHASAPSSTFSSSDLTYEQQKKREQLKQLNQDVIMKESSQPLEEIKIPSSSESKGHLSRTQREDIKNSLQIKKNHWLSVSKSAKMYADGLSGKDRLLQIIVNIDSLLARMISYDYDERSKLITEILPSERSWKILEKDLASLIQQIRTWSSGLKEKNLFEFMKILTCILYQTRAIVLKRINYILMKVIQSYIKKNSPELQSKIIELQQLTITNHNLIVQYFTNARPSYLDAIIPLKFPLTWFKKCLSMEQAQKEYDIENHHKNLIPELQVYYLPLGVHSNLSEVSCFLYHIMKEFIDIFNKYNPNKTLSYTLQSGQNA